MVTVQCAFGGVWGMAETLGGPGRAHVLGKSEERGGEVDLAYLQLDMIN